MYKPLADSTLQRMKKTEIIELLRIAEHNAKVAQEYVDQQAKNLTDWAPVVHGRWVDKPLIKSFKNTNIPVVECSACGIDFCDIINNHYFMYKYCPNCGAKMDGGVDDATD